MNLSNFFGPVHKLLVKRYPEAQTLHKPQERFIGITKYNLVETLKQFKNLKNELSRPEDYEIQMILANPGSSIQEKAQLITHYVSTSKEKVIGAPDYNQLEYAKQVSSKHYYKTLQTIKLQELGGGYFTCPFKKHIYKFVLKELQRLYP